MTDTTKTFCPSHPNAECSMTEGKGRCGLCGMDFSAIYLDRESRDAKWEEAREQGEQKKAEAKAKAKAEAEAKRLAEQEKQKQTQPPTRVEAKPKPPEPEAPATRGAVQSPQASGNWGVAGWAIIIVVVLFGYSAWQDKQEDVAQTQQEIQIKIDAGAPAKELTQPPAATPSAQPHASPGYQAGQRFKDCADCPEMVVIPAGSFDMGSPESKVGHGRDEGPVHRVTIGKAFALGRTEVTQGQWKAVMGSNPSHFNDCGDDCPVDSVSWNDAKEFIQKLNAKTGKQYRLPTEAEWEYAARAEGKHKYSGSDDIGAVAWYETNSGGKTHPVAQKQENAYGLYDMSSNVWEWVQDCYHDNYNGAPDDGSEWKGGCEPARVLRGGSWNYEPQHARPAIRSGSVYADRSSYFGFRLARTAPPIAVASKPTPTSQRLAQSDRDKLAQEGKTRLVNTARQKAEVVTAQSQRYVISADGTEVADQKTGLIWRRCAEGMVYSGGTCTGTANKFNDYSAARKRGQSERRRTGIAWRVPYKDELVSIIGNRNKYPKIDPTVFPATPSNWFFAAEPSGSDFNAWRINFYDGPVSTKAVMARIMYV